MLIRRTIGTAVCWFELVVSAFSAMDAVAAFMGIGVEDGTSQDNPTDPGPLHTLALPKSYQLVHF